jgi:hypothetical protein
MPLNALPVVALWATQAEYSQTLAITYTSTVIN